MSIIDTLKTRSGNQCELCRSTDNLMVYEVLPVAADADKCILTCQICHNQLSGLEETDSNHWRCLSEAMWSDVPAVQVTAYRQLKALSTESWAQDNLDMLYLAEDIQAWADEGLNQDDDHTPTVDSNGTILQAGDNVMLIKDLPVKGGGFTAKRGTPVRNISLTDNPKHIEGRVNGQRIVLVSQFLKKI